MTQLRLPIALTALLLLAFSEPARAQVPQHLNHQGLLTDNAGVIVPDGEYVLRFEIHETPGASGPPPFFQQLTVNVVKGLYNVLLSDNGGGVLTDAFDGATRYLQISVVTSPGGTYDGLVLSPRQQIASVPYALVAGRVGGETPEIRPYPPGHLHGLTLVRTADDRIQIQPGSCRDSEDGANLELASPLTKQIDTGSWAVGNDAGGLGSPVQANVWYHVFVIADDEGTIDAGYDTSVTATNLLGQSGYSHYRRVGSVRTDGSSGIRAFYQIGDTFLWDNPPIDLASGSSPGTNRLETVASIPPDVRTQWLWSGVYGEGFSTPRELTVSAPDVASFTGGPATLSRSRLSGRTWTNSSQQVRFRENTGAAGYSFATLGWVDSRGMD